jgi:ABC-type amino acid transport substrate-binding protein
MNKNLDNYLKEHKHKEGSFLLGNVGTEWQMVKKGEFFSSYPHEDCGCSNLTAISNNDEIEDNEMLKKKAIAVIRGTIHNSVSAMNKLAEKAGYEDFDITYDEIVGMLKLKSYELFGEEG